MTKNVFTALAISALFLASIANANIITINGGESPTFPPTFTTLATGSSPLILPSTACCGVSNSFTVAATAVGTPPLPSGQLDTNTISINSTGAGTLFIWITETGLTDPIVSVTSGLTANLINGAITSVTLSTFLSPTNGISPPNGTPLDTATFTTIGTQTTSSPISVSGTYSLQALYQITATGIGNANLTIDMTSTASSEPATLALLGSSLVGLVLLRRRAREKATNIAGGSYEAQSAA
jgi:hypothetical protein